MCQSITKSLRRTLICLLLVFSILFLAACNSQNNVQLVTSTNTPTTTVQSVSNIIPTPTATPTPSVTPTHTILPSPTATKTPTSTPTQRPTRTPIPTATVFFASEPLINQLEEQGYVSEPVYRFEMRPSSGATFFSNQGQFGRMNFGDPDFNEPVPLKSLTTQLSNGEIYTYIQYMDADTTTCQLLFFVSAEENNRLIGSIDIVNLNQRINNVVTAFQSNPGSPLFCLPYGWQDINDNGKPDMSVTILWANNYTGGEVHIFEVNEDDTITDLTEDLPGPVYHWEFMPSNSSLLVADPAWAKHDCLYPDSPFGFWIYDWDGQSFADVTDRASFSGYIAFLESLLAPGRPFFPEADIGPMVSLLLTYDYSGQRELGWQKFLEFADLQNWPDTDQESLAWLQDDVAHFTNEYEAGLPFTPNDANCGP